MRSRKKRRSSRRRRRRSLLKQETLQWSVEAWRKPGDGSYSGAKNSVTQASLHTLKLWRNKLHPSEVFMVKGSFRLYGSWFNSYALFSFHQCF